MFFLSVIANRKDQALDSSLIWDHHDLDEKECEQYRVTTGDTTPETNERPDFLSAISATSPTVKISFNAATPEKETGMDQEKMDDESDAFQSDPHHGPTTPSGSPSTAALDSVSPATREVLLTLLDYQAHEVVKSVQCRPPIETFAATSGQDVPTVAVENHETLDRTSTPTDKKRRLSSGTYSASLPVLGKRGRRDSRRSSLLPSIDGGGIFFHFFEEKNFKKFFKKFFKK